VIVHRTSQLTAAVFTSDLRRTRSWKRSDLQVARPCDPEDCTIKSQAGIPDLLECRRDCANPTLPGKSSLCQR